MFNKATRKILADNAKARMEQGRKLMDEIDNQRHNFEQDYPDFSGMEVFLNRVHEHIFQCNTQLDTLAELDKGRQ